MAGGLRGLPAPTYCVLLPAGHRDAVVGVLLLAASRRVRGARLGAFAVSGRWRAAALGRRGARSIGGAPDGLLWAFWFARKLRLHHLRLARIADAQIALSNWPFPSLKEKPCE